MEFKKGRCVMKVYVVFKRYENDDESYTTTLVGVFDSEEKAKRDKGDSGWIVEQELNRESQYWQEV